jgi:hypothetical protein
MKKGSERSNVADTSRLIGPESYRVLDFAAYYRYVKARLERAV